MSSDKQVQQLFPLPQTGVRIRDKTSTFDASNIRMFKNFALNLVIFMNIMNLFECDIQTLGTCNHFSECLKRSQIQALSFPLAQCPNHAFTLFFCRVKREKLIVSFCTNYSEITTRDLGHTLGKCLNTGADFECPRNWPCAVVKNKHQLCGCIVVIQKRTKNL